MHILAPSAVGGLERVVQQLAIAQRAEPSISAVHVVTLSSTPVRELEAYLAPMERAGVRIHTIVTPPRAYARQREELRALTEQLTPHIVHSHGAHADVLATKLGEATGAATVSTLHGVVGGDLRNRAYEWMQRRSVRQRDAIVAVSRPLARTLLARGFAPERTHVVRNNWSPGATPLSRTAARQALGLPAYGFVVGWVGRVSREKGLDVLLDALSAFPTLDVYLAVVGDGRERKRLAARAAATEFARQGRVFWCGLVPDAALSLAAFDVLVISSRTEGTPMILFEAMSAAVPIISTAVGGIPDVISGAEALLVPSEDSVAMTAAIDLVHRDARGARLRSIAATRRLAADNDVAHWASCYTSVYRAAMSASARRAAPASLAASAP